MTAATLLVAAALALAALLAAALRRERLVRRGAEAAAAEASRRTSLLSAGTHDALALFGVHHAPLIVNPAFEQLTGYSAAAMHGQPPFLFVLADDRPPVLADAAELPPGGSRTRECRIVSRSGEVRWCALTTSRDAEDGYLVAVADRSEARAADDRLRRDTELLAAVVEVQQAVAAAGLDSDTVLHGIAERCMVLTAADTAAVLVPDGDRLVPRLALGGGVPELRLQGSLAGAAFRSGELRRSEDLAGDTEADRAAWLPFGVRSLAVAPLVHGGRAVGVLLIAAALPGAFAEHDLRVLRHLGGMLAAALAHAGALEARQQRLEERTRALQESEQRFKQLVDTAQEGIWVLDDRGAGTYINPRVTELFGFAAGDMLGRPLMEFVHPESRSAADPLLASSTAGAARADLCFRRRDGGMLWALTAWSPITDRDGRPVGTVVLLSDITDRRRAEERLRHSAERLRTLHQVHEAVLAADSPADVARAALGRLRRLVPSQRSTVLLFDREAGTARIVAGLDGGVPMTEGAIPLADLSPEEQLRRGVVRHVDDIAAEHPRPPMYERLLAAGVRSVLSVPLVVSGETIGELNLGMAMPGSFEPEHRDMAEEVATPLAMAIQQARLRDELARRTAELERRIAAQGAELRQSHADVETLATALGRDLRDPLRHVQGFARLLVEEHGDTLGDAGRHYAERITDGVRELGALLDGLTRLARAARQDLMPRRVELDTLVDETVQEVASGLNGRVVEWQVEQLPTVIADTALLREALAELLANALRHTERAAPARIRVRGFTADGETGVAVEDNGIGFDAAHAERIFDAFARAHAGEGAAPGVGLALVRRIARRHGGRAWGEPRAEGGATFYLTVAAPPRAARG